MKDENIIRLNKTGVLSTVTYGNATSVFAVRQDKTRIRLGWLTDGGTYIALPNPFGDEQQYVNVERLLIYFENIIMGKSEITNDVLVFVDEEPGERCSDGGEYGFYTYLHKIKGNLYLMQSECTCEFASCGTGLEAFILISDEEAQRQPPYGKSKAADIGLKFYGSSNIFAFG